MIECYSLFQDGEFFIPGEPDEIIAAAELAEIQEPVPVIQLPAVVAVQAPVEPAYSERAYIKSLVSKPNTMILHKLGSKGIVAEPADAVAFRSMLSYVLLSRPVILDTVMPKLLGPKTHEGRLIETPKSMLFSMDDMLASKVEE